MFDIDLKQYMINKGLRIDAINEGVQMALDASSQDNIQMTNTISGEKMRYADFVDKTPVFFPHKDEIFIRYPELTLSQWIVPGEPECVNLIREYTIKAIEEIRTLQNHPIKAEFSLKLIKLCLVMEMDEETKELYKYATKTGRSDDALVPWTQILLQDVRRIYGDELLEWYKRYIMGIL